MLGNCTNLLNVLERGRSSLSGKHHCKTRQEAGPCFSTAAARRNIERILLYPDTASLLFRETLNLRLVTYISDVPWTMLLNICSCADYQSGSERCDLKIRLNSPCLNGNLSKCVKSEPSQFLPEKPQFYSQEGFCLWSKVMLTSRGIIQRQRWGLTPSCRRYPTGNRQFNLLGLLRTPLSLCLCCSPFSGSHPSF